MSGPSSFPAVVVRSVDAETVANPTVSIQLLADGPDTGGALSTQRVTLGAGVDGAVPHTHELSAEMFYVLSGSVDVLVGEQVRTATQGDLIVVPPGMAHAFGATPGQTAEILIVITPGVERFEYFRHLGRIASGESTAESLLDDQERYDTYFLMSPPWKAARTS